MSGAFLSSSTLFLIYFQNKAKCSYILTSTEKKMQSKKYSDFWERNIKNCSHHLNLGYLLPELLLLNTVLKFSYFIIFI